MMKKLLMALMMFALMALLVACGAKDEKPADDKRLVTDKPEVRN